MKKIFEIHPWKIIQTKFDPPYHKITESIFSTGNGKMGMRGNFAEDYSGESLKGNYLAGIYIKDKTKVGWWKNGYPEYFAKVPNAIDWISMTVKVNNHIVDLAKFEPIEYRAELDMKNGIFSRKFRLLLPDDKELEIHSQQFYSLSEDNLGVLKYDIKALNSDCTIEIKSRLDYNVRNEDANYDEQFWKKKKYDHPVLPNYIAATSRDTGFDVLCTAINSFFLCSERIRPTCSTRITNDEMTIEQSYRIDVDCGQNLSLIRKAFTVTSFFHKSEHLPKIALTLLDQNQNMSWDQLLKEHSAEWRKIWDKNDIIISGDDASQQGIRYNIFMLNQTYSGVDDRLNIGPKGFTGEKYGGSTYWDTEAYCIPFYMSTKGSKVGRQLLLYRYKHLDKAIENAQTLGFNNGAALYPMVTMNGEECHNEWEITFEEIHRNGAIAYAIYDYVRYTGDDDYLLDYGLEVLVGISRFWKQRFSFSKHKRQYVMLGVTGPNEYENNVNNNWYTSYIARWCIEYTLRTLEEYKEKNITQYIQFITDLAITESEIASWHALIKNIYFPKNKQRGIFLQQDGFLDKELIPVSNLSPAHLPLVKKWSWDRILRSCFIKQADVLQGLFFFENDFDLDTIKRNFEFYEPMTVHESSLSPCVHSILACRLGKMNKAKELFLRTSRLDLDDVNGDTDEGCHITSMAGSWMALVKGFGGQKIINKHLALAPCLPPGWEKLEFGILYRSHSIKVTAVTDSCTIELRGEESMEMFIYGEKITIRPGKNTISSKTIMTI